MPEKAASYELRATSDRLPRSSQLEARSILLQSDFCIQRVHLNSQALRKLFEQVRKGKLSADDAVYQLRHFPFEDLGFAKVDHHRALRQGMPEVIFGQGKSPRQMAEIFARLAQHGGNVLATRVDESQYAAVAAKVEEAEYRPMARAIVLKRDRKKYGKGVIAVVSAGTSDIPVAEEAVVTAEMMGNTVQHIYDVGVAGIHRLLAHRAALAKARVIIVCAGMEGALPSVVGGLVGVPVIAVPTSIGYGAAFGGLAALLGMMNSCASNVSVVNIDNGFGAGYVAALINRR
jgi:pyridinium-3,5-biscarboxylic acid mononucleotide synthase